MNPNDIMPAYEALGYDLSRSDAQSNMEDFPVLRQYQGRAPVVLVMGVGFYEWDPLDTTSPDNNDTIIVDDLGRRWHQKPLEGGNGRFVTRAELATAPVPAMGGYTSVEAQSIFDNALTMQSYTALRAYTGRATGVRLTTPGVNGFFERTADVSSADNGATIIVDSSGRRWRRLYDGDLMASWFGVMGNGVADDTVALQAAFDFVRTSGRAHGLKFKSGDWCSVTAPLRGTNNVLMDGGVLLRAKAPFASVTFDVLTDPANPLTIKPLIYFVDTAPITPGRAGTVDSPSGARRTGLTLNSGIQIQCDEIAEFGVFMDSYINYKIAAPIRKATRWGVWAYNSCWGGSIESYITGPGEGGLWLRKAGNGINLNGLHVWGEDKIPSVAGIQVDGDDNGISFSGAFVEKVRKGLICKNGAGPMVIAGIDFEQVEEETIYINGTLVPGRPNGPIDIQASFLETNSTTHSIVYANNAIVNVRGCRMRGKGAGAVRAFEQSGNGYILNEYNSIESTVLSLGTGRIVKETIENTRTLTSAYYGGAAQTLGVMRGIFNFSDPYDVTVPTTYITFSSAITDTGTQRVVSASTWGANDKLGGVLNGQLGMSLAYTGGGTNKFIIPLTNGDTDFGSSTSKFRHIPLTGSVGFFGATPLTAKPVVTGSRGGNAAIASLLTQLASFGQITDNTTA